MLPRFVLAGALAFAFGLFDNPVRSQGYPIDCDVEFIRGDGNGDGFFAGLKDALFILNYGFLPGAPAPPVLAAADADGDGELLPIVDCVFVLRHQFVPGAPSPPPPFPVPGIDPACAPGVGFFTFAEGFEGWSVREAVFEPGTDGTLAYAEHVEEGDHNPGTVRLTLSESDRGVSLPQPQGSGSGGGHPHAAAIELEIDFAEPEVVIIELNRKWILHGSWDGAPDVVRTYIAIDDQLVPDPRTGTLYLEEISQSVPAGTTVDLDWGSVTVTQPVPSGAHRLTIGGYQFASGGDEDSQLLIDEIRVSLAIPDSTPPSVPQNAGAVATGPTAASVTWDPSFDPESPVSWYRVYRDGTLVQEVTETAFLDVGLTPETDYTYEISATNAHGLESEKSDPTAVTTPSAGSLDREGFQWELLEWSVENPGASGNRFETLARVNFVHTGSGDSHRVTAFYSGSGDTWEFRFTPTLPGEWTFTSEAPDEGRTDPELLGLAGTVEVTAQVDRGFLSHAPIQTGRNGSEWIWSGTGTVFTPRVVMGPDMSYFDGFANPGAEMDRLIEEFFSGHGFNGFHTHVAGNWMDITKRTSIAAGDSGPDPRAFDLLELWIQKVHAAGGIVHLWWWKDESRVTAVHLPGGYNGTVDRILQRYVAARLGPMPGWIAGYGFDCWEYASSANFDQWITRVNDHTGYFRYLGARGDRGSQSSNLPNGSAVTFRSYEQWEVDYEGQNGGSFDLIDTLADRPQKPSSSDDRFRVRNNGNGKDFTLPQTRDFFAQFGMAKVGSIWGDTEHHPSFTVSQINDGEAPSAEYANKKELVVAATVLDTYVTVGMYPYRYLNADGRQVYATASADGSRQVLYLLDHDGVIELPSAILPRSEARIIRASWPDPVDAVYSEYVIPGVNPGETIDLPDNLFPPSPAGATAQMKSNVFVVIQP